MFDFMRAISSMDFRYEQQHYNRCIKIFTSSSFFHLFFSILNLLREWRCLKLIASYTEHTTRNAKQETQNLKHVTLNDVTQNTMSHIVFRKVRSLIAQN